MIEKRLSRAILFSMIDDPFADESDEWLRAREKEAKAARREWRDVDEVGRPDSPWQRLAGMPIPELLSNDVNFFVPLHVIEAIEIVPGRKRGSEEIRFALPGEVLTLVFPGETADLARDVLGRALPGRVR